MSIAIRKYPATDPAAREDPSRSRPGQTTTDPGVDTIIDEYLEVAAGIADSSNFDPGWCITAAALSANVLPKLGIPGVKTVGVDVQYFNAEALIMARLGIPLNDWSPTAYAAGVKGTGTRADSGAWDGHAIAYVPPMSPGGTAYVVDPSSPQFSSASAGVLIDPHCLSVPPRFMRGQTATYKLAAGTRLHVKRNFHLTSFMTFPAAETSYINELADLTLECLRARGITTLRSAEGNR